MKPLSVEMASLGYVEWDTSCSLIRAQKWQDSKTQTNWNSLVKIKIVVILYEIKPSYHLNALIFVIIYVFLFTIIIVDQGHGTAEP